MIKTILVPGVAWPIDMEGNTSANTAYKLGRRRNTIAEMTRHVLMYIKDCPSCTALNMGKALGRHQSRIRIVLDQLQSDGTIIRKRVGKQYHYWISSEVL